LNAAIADRGACKTNDCNELHATCSTKLFNIKHAGVLPHCGHNGEQQSALVQYQNLLGGSDIKFWQFGRQPAWSMVTWSLSQREATSTAINSCHILNPSPCVQARLFIPIWLNGCSLQSKVKCRSTEYLGGIHQGLCALLDHHHIRILNDETSSTTVIPGALPLPSIETLLSNGSFDSSNPAPWSTLLSHKDSPLAIGLKAASTDIQSHLNDTVITRLNLPFYKGPLKLLARIPMAPSLILSPQPFQNVLTFLHINNYLN
jgi:hypothetical protein